MAPRNPLSGRFTYVPPRGAAVSMSPPMPAPGPLALNSAQRPILDFSPSPSVAQTEADCAAVSTPPGPAGPRATMPTTPMQDFSQPMGQTMQGTPSRYPTPITDG